MRELEDNTEVEGLVPPKHTEPPTFEGEETGSEEGRTTELNERERQDFQSLLTIGQRSKTVDVLGHPVVLRTMTVTDELLVGLESKKYKGSEAFARAYQSAVVAATVNTIDGKQLYIPISTEESTAEVFEKKLGKVHKMYPLVVSEIYRHYMEIEKEFAQLAKKLGKL